MHAIRRQRKISWMIIGLVLLGILIAYIFFVPPKNIFSISGFLLFFMISLFYLLLFTLNHPRQALLISIAVTAYLIVRMFDLTHWLYPILLIAIVATLELYFHTQKKPPSSS